MPVDPASLFAQPPDAAQFKSLKRVRYLSEGLFRRALGGAMLDDLWQGGALGHPSGAPFLQNGALWLLDEERALLPEGMRNLGDGRPRPNAALRELSVWEQQSLPHVTVDRVQSASNIYFIKRTHFADGCGLWFGVQWLEPRAQFGSPPRRFDESLHRLIHVLGDEGVGGKRSSGNGRFLAEDPPEAVDLPDAIAGEPALLLSRVSPRADELPALLADPVCAYQIASVAGWMGGMGGPALRRKRVNLLVAGSRVSPPALPVGRLVDVTPAAWADHKVYRYGYGLAVGAGQEDPNGRLSHL
jgi:CRISPR-associated protein Csm4